MASKWITEQQRPDFNWHQFHQYSGLDSCNTLEICLAQAPLIKQRKVEEVFRREMDLCYPLISIELKGMLIDQSCRGKINSELQAQIDKWQLFLTELCGSLNVNSPDQMKSYLFGQLKLPKRVKDGKLSTDEDALLSLMHLQPALIKAILILRGLKKKQSFCNKKLSEDGRVRTTFKPAGTLTGRLSSSKSITGTGDNLQTIMKELREFFICDPGYILIQVDYAKAESWVVAYLAKDEKMIAALQGPDFHCTNASNIFGKPVTKADYGDRQLGKKISHACVTGDHLLFTAVGEITIEKYVRNFNSIPYRIVVADPVEREEWYELPSAVHVYDYSGPMYRFKAEGFEQFVTPTHKMYGIDPNGKVVVLPAEEFALRKDLTTEDNSPLNYTIEEYTGKVYCLTTSSGFFTVKYNDCISVSGNSNYGMTEFQMQLDLAKEGYSFSKTECRELIAAYFRAYPKIKQNYHNWIEECLRTTRTLTTPFGRKVTFWDFWSNRLLNQSYAFIPQSTVGDMTNQALLNVYKNLPHVDILLQVHDSLVMQVKIEDYTPELIEQIKKCMSVPLTIKGCTIDIPVDLEVGWNWYKLVDVEVMDEVIRRMNFPVAHERYLDYRSTIFKQVTTELDITSTIKKKAKAEDHKDIETLQAKVESLESSLIKTNTYLESFLL